MRYIDITQTISTGMKKYSSDPCVKINQFKSLKRGNSCNLSELTLGTHSGTHIDAPRHIFNRAKTVDRLNLDDLICEVFVTDIGAFLKKGFFAGINRKKVRGVLFNSRKGVAMLTEEQARILVEKNIKLVGTDQLSIEKSSDKSHPAHCLLLANDIIIVENLCLKKANPGHYKLICLPLKIKKGDGSPVRAILAK